jgi:hypothetical protein
MRLRFVGCYSSVKKVAYQQTMSIQYRFPKSHGSVLIATLFHFAFNFSLELVSAGLGLIPLAALFAIQTAVYTRLAAVLIIYGGKYLTKER